MRKKTRGSKTWSDRLLVDRTNPFVMAHDTLEVARLLKRTNSHKDEKIKSRLREELRKLTLHQMGRDEDEEMRIERVRMGRGEERREKRKKGGVKEIYRKEQGLANNQNRKAQDVMWQRQTTHFLSE